MDDMTAASKKTAVAVTDFEGAMRKASVQADVIEHAIEKIVDFAIEATKKFIELGHAVGEYEDMAIRAGTDNPAGLATLKTAADLAHTSVDALVTRMTYMDQVLNQGGTRSTRAEQALKNLNINIREFQAMAADEQYRKLSEQFEQFANSGTKVANVMALFGRGGADQLVVMHKMAEAGPPIIKYTNEQIVAIAEHTTQLEKNRSHLQQWVQAISAETIPAQAALYKSIGDLIQRWAELKDGFSEDKKKAIVNFSFDIASGVAVLIDLTAKYIASTKVDMLQIELIWTRLKFGSKASVDEIKRLKAEIAALQKFAVEGPGTEAAVEAARAKALSEHGEGHGGGKPRMGGLGDEDSRSKMIKDIDFIGKAFADVQRDLDKLDEKLDPAGEKLRDFLALHPDTVEWKNYVELINRLTQKTDELAASKMIEQLKEEAALIGMSEVQQRAYKISKMGVSDAIQQQYLAQIKTNDAMKEHQKIIDEVKHANESALPAYDEYIKRLQHIQLLVKNGLKPEAEAELTYNASKDYLKRVADETKKVSNELDEFTKQAARNIQDSLGSTLEDTLAGHFDNIGDLWLSMLRRMAAQAAAANLAKYFLGDYSTTGNLGGVIGGLWKGSESSPGFVGPPSELAGAASGRVQSLVYSPTTHISVDSRADQAQTAQIAGTMVEEGHKRAFAELRERGVL